ncbi:MAG TPA: hypothetical protein VKR31_00205 [Rhizomicrobium sp.]|nr:hypothetical protein [Rhizomicrobium sp.]
MAKYDALGPFLKGQSTGEVPVTFSEVENVIGEKLPRSAYVHRPWWSNNPSNSAMTRVWLDAGFRTERVDMAGQKLVFRRIHERSFGEAAPPAYAGPTPPRDNVEKEPRRHPLFGRLKGTFTIDPAWDLTQPAMPEWDEKYGPDPKK